MNHEIYLFILYIMNTIKINHIYYKFLFCFFIAKYISLYNKIILVLFKFIRNT